MKPLLLFDVNETLLDLSPLNSDFKEIFGNADYRRTWFENVLHNSLVLNQVGQYRPFSDLCEASLINLARVAEVDLSEAAKEQFFSKLKMLPLHPEVAEALHLLKSSGYRIATLSNSSVKTVQTQLTQQGVSGYFEALLSTDSVRCFKPARETYLYAAEKLGLPIGEVCLIAAHSWDTAGAIHAGAQAALVKRSGLGFEPILSDPELQAENLLFLARKLSQRWNETGDQNALRTA